MGPLIQFTFLEYLLALKADAKSVLLHISAYQLCIYVAVNRSICKTPFIATNLQKIPSKHHMHILATSTSFHHTTLPHHTYNTHNTFIVPLPLQILSTSYGKTWPPPAHTHTHTIPHHCISLCLLLQAIIALAFMSSEIGFSIAYLQVLLFNMMSNTCICPWSWKG